MTPLSQTLVRPTVSVGLPRADVPGPVWGIPLVFDDPGREAYRLLGSAWRSPIARLMRTGGDFDAVRVPQPYAAPALEYLRRLGARRGAVPAERDVWTFFVPPLSDDLPWPPWVTYLSGPTVWIPPRAARGDGLSLRWITRGEPVGQLLTAPFVLCPILTALAAPIPGPARART
ncbi:hypothetical protein ABT063_10305 [Streptomyces sp. NPDC002838]|uniref:hypothetical protein n=1 Tax=Streptomyces sp. NPDC002838 TaxID=3154436 RepID=UPI00332E3A75